MGGVPEALIGDADGTLVGRPGERLFVVDRGDGPAVLLVHGFPSNVVAWSRVLPRLAGTRRVVAVDLLGLGRSDRPGPRAPAGQLAPSAHADRLAGLAAGLGIERLTAVGLSYGGAVVQWLSVRHPALVERLVLVASVDPSEPRRLAGRWRLQGLALAAGLTAPAVARRVLAAGMRADAVAPDGITMPVVEAYLAPLLRPGSRRALWRYGRDAAGDASLDHRAIGAPTTILAGTDDRTVPFGVARRLASRLPNARLDPVAGGRHLLTWDHPAVVARAVLGD